MFLYLTSLAPITITHLQIHFETISQTGIVICHSQACFALFLFQETFRAKQIPPLIFTDMQIAPSGQRFIGTYAKNNNQYSRKEADPVKERCQNQKLQPHKF